jgi:hypothetical protein
LKALDSGVHLIDNGLRRHYSFYGVRYVRREDVANKNDCCVEGLSLNPSAYDSKTKLSNGGYDHPCRSRLCDIETDRNGYGFSSLTFAVVIDGRYVAAESRNRFEDANQLAWPVLKFKFNLYFDQI